jgi:hypothetical protein
MQGQWRRLAALLTRDAIILGIALWVWSQALAHPGSWPLAVGAAVLTALCGYLLHEWGHLLGALAWRCAFELPPTPFSSPFLFRFIRDRNNRPQFFAMALGGFAASILTVLGLLAALPWTLLASQLTLALTGLGVLATLVIEVPEFLRVWRGAPIPRGAAFISKQELPS